MKSACFVTSVGPNAVVSLGEQRPQHRVGVGGAVRKRRAGQAPHAVGHVRHGAGLVEHLAVVDQRAVQGLRPLRREGLGVVRLVGDDQIPPAFQKLDAQRRLRQSGPPDDRARNLGVEIAPAEHHLHVSAERRPVAEAGLPHAATGGCRHDQDRLGHYVVGGHDRRAGLADARQVREKRVVTGCEKMGAAQLRRLGEHGRHHMALPARNPSRQFLSIVILDEQDAICQCRLPRPRSGRSQRCRQSCRGGRASRTAWPLS